MENNSKTSHGNHPQQPRSTSPSSSAPHPPWSQRRRKNHAHSRTYAPPFSSSHPSLQFHHFSLLTIPQVYSTIGTKVLTSRVTWTSPILLNPTTVSRFHGPRGPTVHRRPSPTAGKASNNVLRLWLRRPFVLAPSLLDKYSFPSTNGMVSLPPSATC